MRQIISLGTIEEWEQVEVILAEDNTIQVEARNHTKGRYHATIRYDATIKHEQRLLPSLGYDPHPEQNRPNIWRILAAIPAEHRAIAQVIEKAYSYSTGEGQ